MNTLLHITNKGQAVWLDSLSRDILQSGKLQHLTHIGLSGVTSNPVIFENAITKSTAYDQDIRTHTKYTDSPKDIFEFIATQDIKTAADILHTVYEATDKTDGYVSIEVDPRFAHNPQDTVIEAQRLWQRIGRPNVMIKVPGTKESAQSIRKLISLGINVNVTLLFSIESYIRAAQAYIQGLHDYIASGKGTPSSVNSVASFFISRVDTKVDSMLTTDDPRRGKAGILNALEAYKHFNNIFSFSGRSNSQFIQLLSKGANVQKVLFASTSVKNPSYKSSLYIDNLLLKDTINTMTEPMLEEILSSYNSEVTDSLNSNYTYSELYSSLNESGISLETVTEQLLEEGIALFSEAYNRLLSVVAQKAGSIKETC